MLALGLNNIHSTHGKIKIIKNLSDSIFQIPKSFRFKVQIQIFVRIRKQASSFPLVFYSGDFLRQNDIISWIWGRGRSLRRGGLSEELRGQTLFIILDYFRTVL